MSKEKVKASAFFVQAAATLSIAYLTSLIGFIYAWPSYTLENLVSNNTVLSWPLSTTEVSLLGSITNVGALAVTPVCGYAVDRIGRKYTAMLFGLPSVLAWTMIAFTTYVPLVITAVGIAGFSAAGQAVSSVYISEIAQDSIRGSLVSSCVYGYFFGLLSSYILGGYLSYYQVVYAHLSLSVLYVVLIALLKESHVFLMQTGKEEEARKSLAFYRQCSVGSKEVEMEMRKLKLQLDPRIEEILRRENDGEVTEKLMEELPAPLAPALSPWKFLRQSESSMRALRTVLTLMAANVLMGAIVIQVYAEPLFKEAVPSMPSNLCSIFLALDLMLASMISAAIVDRLGRRVGIYAPVLINYVKVDVEKRAVLMTYSCIASGVFTVLLASQLQHQFAPHWVTAFFLYAYNFVYNLGAATVPFILTSEVFLPEVRGLCNSLTMACMWITNFFMLIIFNPLVTWFGLNTLFYGFSVVCFLTALYSQLYLPETKGLAADEIQLRFLRRRRDKGVKA